MLAIYAPYVRETTYSFEYVPPTMREFGARFDATVERFPWLVCEAGGRVIGYAYASPAFERAAFQWDADISVYIDPSYHGRGIGSRFYVQIEEKLLSLGFHNVYALVTGENTGSCRFHEALGYTLLATLPKTGFKHGKWLDLFWYGKRLQKDLPPI